MDLEKYRRLFVEEANDHMIEMSRALTALEGGPSRQDADERDVKRPDPPSHP